MPIENGENRNKKGQFVAGNTASVGKGRPKGTKSIPDILRKISDEEGTTNGMDKLEVVMRQVFNFALEGKSWAVQFIAERLEGKAKEHIITEEFKPIRVLEFGDDLIDER
tara:strand:- start:146 stop:475 length:330 start_codon:yes stop_codon:yes gene_type:complete